MVHVLGQAGIPFNLGLFFSVCLFKVSVELVECVVQRLELVLSSGLVVVLAVDCVEFFLNAHDISLHVHDCEVVANELEPVLVERGLLRNGFVRDVLETIHVGIDYVFFVDVLVDAVFNHLLDVLNKLFNHAEEILEDFPNRALHRVNGVGYLEVQHFESEEEAVFLGVRSEFIVLLQMSQQFS